MASGDERRHGKEPMVVEEDEFPAAEEEDNFSAAVERVMVPAAVERVMVPAAVERFMVPAAVEKAKFPAGLRVLAVDDDAVCLRVLEVLLNICQFIPTMMKDARQALQLLRDGGEDQFDLVITDVHMPDMDGFKFLELIGLEMDLPVIMLSVNGERETVYKGIAHGACDYLVKPVNLKELKNIWQHVVRKTYVVVNHNSSDSDDADQRVVQRVIAEDEQGGSTSRRCSKKKRSSGNDSYENNERARVQTTRKKPRVSWTGELHARFLEAVDQLGVDRAVPKTILQLMNVHNLSRESVASHLQKYRLFLKRVTDEPSKACYMNMQHQGTLRDHQEHQRALPSSAGCICGAHNPYAAPSLLGPHGLPVQQRNWAVDTVGNAVPWLPDTGNRHASGPSFADQPMLDALNPRHCRIVYAGVLREKLLEACSAEPSSHPGSSSFAEMPNGGVLSPVNQLPVQPPEFGNQFSGPMYVAPSVVATHRDTQLPYLSGNSSIPLQNVVPSSFPNHMDGAPLSQSQVNIPLINPMDGAHLSQSQVNIPLINPMDGAPLSQSQVNIPLMINQLPSFGPSPGQMPMFQNEQQNQMEGIIIGNTASVGVLSEQMTPLFNLAEASDIAPIEMTNDNFPPMTEMMVNGGSTSSPSPNLQTGSSVAPPAQMVNGGSTSSALLDLQDSSVAPTQVLNDGDASGILLVQDGPADQQAPDGGQQAPDDGQQAPDDGQQAPDDGQQAPDYGQQAPDYGQQAFDYGQQAFDDDQPTYSSPFFLEEIFANMVQQQDFNDDVFLGGEY